jgi:hypothetical protein
MWRENPLDPSVRITFEVIDEERWQRTNFSRTENGGWQPVSLLRATCIPCE